MRVMPGEPQRPTARAVRFARANGLGYVVFGLLTLAGALSSLGLDALLGAWLAAAGLIERRAAAALEKGDSSAGKTLSRNELALCGAIVGYAALRITAFPSPGLSDPALLGDALGLGASDVAEMAAEMAKLLYSTVAIVSVVYQGGAAYYFSRFGGSDVGT
jgi:hypothetical protein